jgi:hypothetical protein
MNNEQREQFSPDITPSCRSFVRRQVTYCDQAEFGWLGIKGHHLSNISGSKKSVITSLRSRNTHIARIYFNI